MVEKWTVTIPELTGSEERYAYIYLPELYEEDPEYRFPVLYMFDGHNVFFDSDATYGKSWGMKEYMDEQQIPMIIAAVECNHHPDNGRLKEYAPFTFRNSKLGTITGRGRITMDWLSGTFKNYIDSHYRTRPDRDHTYIAGSSMGGLMTIYAVMAYNHIYSRGAALSPSLWTSGKLTKLIQQAEIDPNTILYMDYGSKEMRNHRDMEEQFLRVTRLLLEKKVKLTSRIVPGGTHCEASWERQIPFFMQVLTYS